MRVPTPIRLAAIAISLVPALASALTPEETRTLTEVNRAYVSLTRATTPAVVNISSTKVIRTTEGNPSTPFLDDPVFRQFFGDLFPQVPREIREQSLGSGVLIDPSGILVTNHHVVERASSVKVALADGREFDAEILGTDPQTDVAVLRIRGKGNLPALPWGDSDALQPGESVLAVGNPFGLGQTVTRGIVSAIGRSGIGGSTRYENYIQTDASINPGNSGGALVNLRGELIGINAAIRSNTGSFAGISFAIPSNLARRVLESLVKTGRVVRSWLGAEGQHLTPKLARQFGLDRPRGVLITGVAPGGPADKAGLTRGDIVLAIGNTAIADESQLDATVAQTAPGATLRLSVWRGGEEQTLAVTLAETPDARAGGGSYGNVLDGMRAADLTPALARRSRIAPGARGVILTRVVPGSAAEGAGFHAGDVIQGLNRVEVRSLREYDQIARLIPRDQAVLVYVVRGEDAYFVTLSPE